MLVYRVQLRTNPYVGPYRYDYPELLGITYDWRFKGDAIRYPHPYIDGIDLDKVKSKHFFGFASVGDLHNWFAEAFAVLDRYGFTAVAYEVPDEHIMLGTKQLVFDMTKAVRVS